MALMQTVFLAVLLSLGAGSAWAFEGEVDLTRLRAEAADGDAAAATRLAEALMVADTGQASSEVVSLLEQGVAGDQNRARAILGALYLFGVGVPADARQAVSLLGSAAEGGDNEARFNLALAYEQGAGVERDLGRALVLLRQAADDGSAPAMGGVGIYLSKGLGVAADPIEASKWFRRGAEAGDSNSAYHLAEMLLEGRGVKQDVSEAVVFYEQAAKARNEPAALRLVALLLDGKHLEKDPTRARDLLEHFAGLGGANSALVLGILLDEGVHFEEDPATAANWLMQAANAGHADAQVRLARAYELGRGVDPDPALREQWLRQAAASGHFGARLAVSGLQGERERRESIPANVVALVRSAAESGEAGAQFEIALFARDGRGMPRDRDAAERWLRLSASAGVIAANRELGALLLGANEETRQGEAVTLLARSAKAGDADAAFMLGQARQFGRGIRADAGEARKWFMQAALQDHRDAPSALAQTHWNGKRKDQEAALAWLLLPDGDDGIEWLRHRAGDFARGELGRTPADPAFSLLLSGMALALGDEDARTRHEELAAKLDARQRAEVETALARWQALRDRPHPQLRWRTARSETRANRWKDPTAAKGAAERARAAAGEAFGEHSLPIAEAIELQADLARARRDVAAARALYEQALAIRLGSQPDYHVDVIANRRDHAALFTVEKNHAAAADALLTLLPRAERLHGKGSVQLQSLHQDIGDALYFADRSDQAIVHLRRALELLSRDPLRQAALERADAEQSLARALAETAQTDEAIALLRTSIAALRNADDDVGMGLYPPLTRLMLILWNAERLDEAAAAQAEVVALLESERPEAQDEIDAEKLVLDRLRVAAAEGEGYGRRPDRKALRAKAEAGDTAAQLSLANHLMMGTFGAADVESAASWFRKAAEGGEAIAQYNLAILLGEGRGVAENRNEAVTWLRRSAAQNFAEAKASLGYYLTDGEDSDDDIAEAVQLFEESAAQGSATGQFNLGNHLIAGNGIEQDIVRGIALHREAAAAGLPEAIRALALSSLKGEHVPLDAEAGLRGLLDAARLGDPFALEMVCNLRGGESIRYVTTLIRLPEGESLAPEIASQCAAEDDGG